jgi:membrane-associated phospholipid phosphatase
MIEPRHCRPWLAIVALWGLLVPSMGRAAAEGPPTQNSAFGSPVSNSLFASPSHFLDTIRQDYEDLYLSPSHLIRLGAAFGAGAIMANVNIDRETQEWYQDHLRTKAGDRVSDVAKVFGEGQYLIPVAVAAALLGDRLHFDEGISPVGTWGGRATRAYLTGGSALLATQWLTGGSRPAENDSHWRPFHDNDGVSGHAFIGAVPFLTAGRLCEENPLVRYLLYAASALPALSRINDNAHYPSQAFLGWFLAWEATGAIAQRERGDRRISIAPASMGDAYGLALCVRW